MTVLAVRVCGCASPLVERDGGLFCPECGVVSRWLVVVDGQAVAAADRNELFIRSSVLREGLGLTAANLPADEEE